jgi:hypothetical protein
MRAIIDASMKIATFNINNVNKRLGNLLAWLRIAKPDVVCLQELKATDAEFPMSTIEGAGYGTAWRGQKSWNGVAILARDCEPIVTRRELPGAVATLHRRRTYGSFARSRRWTRRPPAKPAQSKADMAQGGSVGARLAAQPTRKAIGRTGFARSMIRDGVYGKCEKRLLAISDMHKHRGLRPQTSRVGIERLRRDRDSRGHRQHRAAEIFETLKTFQCPIVYVRQDQRKIMLLTIRPIMLLVMIGIPWQRLDSQL